MSFSPPSLYAVTKKNPYVKMGKIVRRFEDGYEEVIPGTEEGRLDQMGYTGFIWPHRTLAPFLNAIRKHGADLGSARMDRRKAMEQHGE